MKSAAMTALVLSLVLPLQALSAPGDWNVYLDSSAIVDIHRAGDSLFCATNGGILIFDLTDSTFTQLLDGLDLRSADIRSVTVDAEGSIWAAFVSAGISRIDDPGGGNTVQTYTANSTFNEIINDTVTCIERIGDEVYYGCAAGVGKFFEGIHSLEPNLSDSLSGKRVNCIFYEEDRDILWIAYDGGVARFARETFNYSSWPVGPAYSVCLHEGEVYCGTDDGVYIFDGSDWTLFGSGFHYGLSVLNVASGSSGLYAITEQRLYRYNGTFWASIDAAALISIFDQEYRIRTNHIAALAVDQAGTPWVGGRVNVGPARGSFLSGYYGGAWNNKAMPLLSQNQIVSVSTAPGGGVWASTYYGISYRSGDGDWTAYTRMRPDTGDDEALSYYAKNLTLLFDSQGFLWCNSLKYDLDLLDVGDPFSRADDQWEHFSVSDGLSISSDRFVRAKEDPAGNRWFLSDDDDQLDGKWGINIINAAGTEWLLVDPLTTPSMPSGSVFDCDFTPVGVYLALRGYGVVFWRTNGFSWNALTNQDDDVWTTVLGQDDLPATQLKAIEAASDGSLWVGTSSGLVRQSGNDIDLFELKTSFGDEGLIGLDIYDLELDIRGNIWVATNQGLNRVTPAGEIDRAFTTASFWEENFQFVYPQTVISPLPSHICNQLAYDRVDDVLWIATEDGLARLDVSPEQEVEIPLARALLYPNPLHIGRGDNSLRISRISGTVDIKVYTVEGELVHEAFGVGDGEEAWDLLSLNGFKARSGIYIVRISGEGSSEMRKVAVIR